MAPKAAPKTVPVTEAELTAARQILLRAQSAGVQKSEESSAGYGSMSDASKRQRGPEDWELEEWEAIAYQEQQKALHDERLQADGASSQMPVSKMDVSYDEMTKDSSLEKYLVWVEQHGTGKGGRFEDLCAYLKAIDYTASKKLGSSSKCTYPGGTEIREKKK
ncbi:unnamed protein product [Durusdinium trenchii]|uniref:Uncharacterized protein n=2 Tax=Durusdinium trenchii TaxID=1381693 RepID=A0ABP0RHR6_9DINO